MYQQYSQHGHDDSDSYIVFIIVLAAVAYWLIKRYLVINSHLLSVVTLVILAIIFMILVVFIIKKIAKRSKQPSQLTPHLWVNMDGRQFEDQMVIWLQNYGFNTVVKTEYFDKGVDLLASMPGHLVGVQVKRSTKPVGVGAVRAVVAGKKAYGCSAAMVITNSSFTSQAINLAKINNCRLVDGKQLLKLS